ncbi:ADYC domain-containing protein [Ideonella sp.]|uniref:ADYC domain-containing protein n=1 Tax=Ideonella sp. TaxID=1929293 RepID=UPI0035AFF23B
MRKLLALALVLWACQGQVHAQVSAPGPGADRLPALRAVGTEWVLQLPDGSSLGSARLVGAQLRLAGGAVVRLDAAHIETGPSGRTWWAHELSVQLASGSWQPLCAPHSDGTQYAVVLPGREMPDGSLGEGDGFALSCTTGALAKCLRMGYEPWHSGPGGHRMRAAFQACLRMVRADYGGDGTPHTENGQRIDVFDDLGVQEADRLPGQSFEAGWSPQGAVCVHHPRVATASTLADLQARYPALHGQTGDLCTEAYARSLGALVFNRSSGPREQ